MQTREDSLVSIIMTGLFATIIYLGVWVLRIPVPALVGCPFIYFGNTLTVVTILYLGYRNGMLAEVIGLGGFSSLNGYAATSWSTMLEMVVVASVLTAVYKEMHHQDSKKNIIVLRIIAGVAKIFTIYCVSIVEALVAGTSSDVALISSFMSLPATVVNPILTAICTSILYFTVQSGARKALRKSVQLKISLL